MMKMKCPFCGPSEFIEIPLISIWIEGTIYAENGTSMACTKCGHVEITADPDMIKNILDRKKTEQRNKETIAKLEKEIQSIEEEIERLEKIIADENQTVKNVRIAKEKIASLNDDIHSLREQLKRIPVEEECNEVIIGR